jgi:MYXO-CTERM domain-containing protein
MRYGSIAERMPETPTAKVAAPALALLGLGALLLSRRQADREPPTPLPDPAAPPIDRGTAVRAARRLNRAAGTLAASVLADSAVEHYRGSFHNPAMFAPLITSALSLVVSVHGVGDRRPAAHWLRDGVYVAAALTGLVGTGFHIFNVRRKPGGFSWQNLFYSAPIGAPAALVLSGGVGFLAERVRDNPPGSAPTIGGLPAGRVVAAATGAGLFGTVGEAGLLHFRGAYHDPFMFAPVTIPPVAAALLAGVACGPAHAERPLTRWWLRLTALLGFVGTGFHAYGVSRNMGGWRNWRQNVLNGPPLPAPPSFIGLALAGLAALGLLEDHPDG